MAAVRQIVEIPREAEMRTEPARVIGEQYAGKDNVRLLIVGGAGLAAALGVNFAPDVPQYVEMIANAGIPMILAAYAKWQLARNAKAQAEDTRAVAFSPATAERLAASTQPAKIVVTPAAEMIERSKAA